MILRLLMCIALAMFPLVVMASPGDGKPIEWVVGYAPGGGSDAVARMLAEAMGRSLNRPVFVSNKPGAGANIAADYVAKARDAEHLMFTADSAILAANPFLYSRLSYSADKDFTPVGMIARFPLVLVVHPSAPVRNLGEFLAWAKSDPKGMSYGSPGAGSPHHLVTELFRAQTGLTLSHVPYRGAAPAIADLVGGQLPFMFVDTSSGGAFISSGKVRAIGVASAQRLKTMGEVPTLIEQGLSGFEAYAWQALVAPAGAKPATVALLNRTLNEALNSTEIKARMQVLGIEPLPTTPAESARYAAQERERWSRVIRTANIKLD
ncbi:tripartite tricarboxylate transporter substrate binding protein [Ramlibacter sp. 2FC]|uniref:Bug family tripartite tricarboxylate transporter substrate binding protein n=1 Tax=Ramlibacter sp. 2FC TaxID=2502188 RepID=UPI0010F9F4C3|nr:tripartite tricarboxylate transporter substrate binding protein [Ramlibacter sp. 2FC]